MGQKAEEENRPQLFPVMQNHKTENFVHQYNRLLKTLHSYPPKNISFAQDILILFKNYYNTVI